MSRPCKYIHIGIGVVLAISLILALAFVMSWLDFLYICSYVKLVITLIKYVPQVLQSICLNIHMCHHESVLLGIHELPKKEYHGLVYWQRVVGLYRRTLEHFANVFHCL